MVAPTLAAGTPGFPAIVTGPVLEWQDRWLDRPESLAGAVIYDRGQTPLFRTAFIVEHGAKALLMAEGGKNYHPLILATEAGLPTIAGIGQVDLAGGRQVTVDAGAGKVYPALPSATATTAPAIAASNAVDLPAVYVNVGYPSALPAAAASGAAGLGLLRTEFAAVKTLALHLDQRLDDGRCGRELLEQAGGNEADTIYTLALDQQGRSLLKAGFHEVVAAAVTSFGEREVIVRTLDIARHLDEPMGNRGIRRCVGSGGTTIRLLCEAIRDVLEERGGQIGLILPLVSHYSQIRATMEQVLACGLTLERPGSTAPRQIRFGWEIEQPAAAHNNALWLAAFTAEFGQAPHLLGIGTNDLTQFTIALGRDVYAAETDPALADYLRALYDEHEFSVVRQILEAAAQCRAAGTHVFLLGQAGADPMLAPLLFAARITPSVAPARVAEVQAMARASMQPGAALEAIAAYQGRVLRTYPPAARAAVARELEAFFRATLPDLIKG
ncbi:MAG: putative PEP-binding protein [Candidatus Competibacteraceae bacterium]